MISKEAWFTLTASEAEIRRLKETIRRDPLNREALERLYVLEKRLGQGENGGWGFYEWAPEAVIRFANSMTSLHSLLYYYDPDKYDTLPEEATKTNHRFYLDYIRDNNYLRGVKDFQEFWPDPMPEVSKMVEAIEAGDLPTIVKLTPTLAHYSSSIYRAYDVVWEQLQDKYEGEAVRDPSDGSLTRTPPS